LRNPGGSGRFSDSRIVLLATPSHHAWGMTVVIMAFVPVYSGGTATDLHRLPF
jgi:hypothetical protein